jgi:hypothetical protein
MLLISIASKVSSAFSLVGRFSTSAFSNRFITRNYRTSLPLKSTSINTDDDTIITPRDSSTIHNFGPASSRDTTLFTCERPGGDPESGSIPASAIEDWADFMREKGIDQVLVLLDDNELECYEDPGLLELYQNFGFTVHRNPMGEAGASTRAMDTISACLTNGKKIVAHCTHGQGRAGRVAAAWLTHKYDLSLEEATEEALATASRLGVTRLGSPTKLKTWLENL